MIIARLRDPVAQNRPNAAMIAATPASVRQPIFAASVSRWPHQRLTFSVDQIMRVTWTAAPVCAACKATVEIRYPADFFAYPQIQINTVMLIVNAVVIAALLTIFVSTPMKAVSKIRPMKHGS